MSAVLRRAAISMQIPLALSADPDSTWQVGPFNNRWREGSDRELSGDRVGRRKYLIEGLDEILYNNRWHQSSPSLSLPPVAGVTKVKAVEVWRLPTTGPRPNGILIVHLSIDPDADVLRVINKVVNHNPSHGGAMRLWVDEIVDPWGRIVSSHRRAEHVSLVTSDSSTMPDTPLVKVSKKIDGHNLWLASLEASGRYGPDVTMMPNVGTYIPMSNRIRGLVGRGAIALVGLLPDDGSSRGATGFDYGGLEFFAEGLYTDTLLFARLQRIMVGELRDELAEARNSGTGKQALWRLERRLVDFRRIYWRTDIAPQGSQDDFLRAYQAENAVPAQLAEVAAQLTEYSAQVQRTEQEITNALLGLVTVVALPISSAIAIWAGIDERTVCQLLIALGIAMALAAVLVATPAARSLLKPLFKKKHVS
ncbi:hypothetical protein [Antiquaquibacter soli]|uniref:CorA-like Mg2+ transporter protein n=1 Tax=Antiquaquibacter soli TaxID=3064523 RepID=A0ABT9BSP4_9MICO|nr:hypothetical protein [Protaetiibacter sp. WY-16]MDO7883432.1 hypothetical protein [Protaetiibacter sp. WY-16]